jgi:hypothetical protein
MPRIDVLKLPGRWRWNRFAAWSVDDWGTSGPIMLGRNSAIVVEKVRAHMEKQMEEKADESP